MKKSPRDPTLLKIGEEKKGSRVEENIPHPQRGALRLVNFLCIHEGERAENIMKLGLGKKCG